MMYAITGITGKVGGTMARALLAAGQPIRAVVRDAKKGEAWAALGGEIAFAEMEDTAALTKAVIGAAAIFADRLCPISARPRSYGRDAGRDRREAWRQRGSNCDRLAARPGWVIAIPKPGRLESQRANLDAQAIRLDDADRAAISALPKDQRFDRPPFAPNWDEKLSPTICSAESDLQSWA
jgi:hypothetical protein